MPYIGKQLVRGQNRKLDDISSGFNGSQTTFTLQVASQNVTVGSALQLWISLGGVIQEPTIDYTIAGSQITFTTAPAASLDFFGVIQGDVTDTNTPGDATVTTSKLSTGLTVNLADGSAATSSLQLGGTDSGLFSSAADKVNVTTGGVERLEIGDSEVVFNDPSNDVDFRVESNGNANMLFVDGGNDRVGIGISAPKRLLHLDGGSGGVQIQLTNDTTGKTSDGDGFQLQVAGDGTARVTQRENLNLAFDTNNTERMRIDSSGRLLIGTTSARGVGHGTAGAFEIEGTSATVFASVVKNSADAFGCSIALGKSRGTSVGANTAVQSGDELGSIRFAGADGTDVQTRAAQITAAVDGTPGSNDMPGRLVFSTTADGASSPTERVRINSSGNMGIGTASPLRALTVAKIGSIISGTGNSYGFSINPLSSGYVYLDAVTSGSSNTSLSLRTYNNGTYTQVIQSISGNDTTFETAGTERMRIDSSGRTLVGLTSFPDSDKFAIRGNASNDEEALISLLRGSLPSSTQTLGELRFHGNGNQTPAASITVKRDSGSWTSGSSHPGRIEFKTTPNGSSSPTEKYVIESDGEQRMFSTNTSYTLVLNNGTSAGTSYLFLEGRHSTTSNTGLTGTRSLAITTNGNIYNTNNSYNAISDARLKENIVDASSQWQDIKDIRVRNYNFIEGQTHTQIGVVAQEVETVSPGLVSELPDRDDEGNILETVTKSVNYSVLYMKAIKALQEAMDRIETLETKVAALEAE